MALAPSALGKTMHRLGTLPPGGLARASRDRTMTLLGVLGAMLFGVLLSASISLHIVLTLALLPLVLAVVWTSPRTTILGLAFWLVALGLVRRLVGSGSSTGLGDPLLLIGPAVLVLLFVVACGRGALRGRTRLANAVALLSLLALVEAVNPLQGGLAVGLGGLLFILVPMLAFWSGRALVDDRTLGSLFRLVAVMSVLSAIYGLVQQFIGFPSWDARWVISNGYIALNVGGVTRAFASFSSSTEYATFLCIGLVVLISRVGTGRRALLPLHLAAIALVGTALVLSSVRGSAIITVAAVGAIAAARAGLRPLLALGVGILAVVSLGVGLSHVSVSPQTGAAEAQNPTAGLLQHEISGISDPTGANSTIPGHLSETLHGIAAAFSLPIGHGTGSVTLAAGRLGGATNVGTEGDPGNVATALGLPGLALYLVILISGILSSYQLAARRRDALGFATLGLVVVVAFQWMNGDLYSVAWLVWLGLGWVDRSITSPVSDSALVPVRKVTVPRARPAT